VVEDVRTGIEHRSQRRLAPLEVRDEDLDAAPRDALAREPDRLGEDERPAVVEVVAVDGGDDRVLQPHPIDRFRDAAWFIDVERRRPPVRDGAVRTGARADVTQDHEGRCAVMPALADVRAMRVLAHGVELQVLHDPLEPEVVLRPRGSDFQPLRLGFARTDELQGNFDSHGSS
jgi:hypothetical protein